MISLSIPDMPLRRAMCLPDRPAREGIPHTTGTVLLCPQSGNAFMFVRSITRSTVHALLVFDDDGALAGVAEATRDKLDRLFVVGRVTNLPAMLEVEWS